MTKATSVLFVSVFFSAAACGQTLEWTRQHVSDFDFNYAGSVAVDGLGNVFATGRSGDGNTFEGMSFISKYDADGTPQWTQAAAGGVAADGTGGFYLAGATGDSGNQDPLVSRYDADGRLQWARQLGTDDNDWSQAVAADGLGNVYIAGGILTSPNPLPGSLDSFVSKYDSDGTVQWTRQFGTDDVDDLTHGVATDGLGNVYVTGHNFEFVPSGVDTNVFVTKYDAEGEFQWMRQLGTEESDQSWGVAADGLGNVYISGSTSGGLDGPFAGGDRDAFVAKYDADGSFQWARQIGTDSYEDANRVAVDGFGGVYVAGTTGGSLNGEFFGESDAFVSKYDSDGTLRWVRQFGSDWLDSGDAVSADGRGNVYVATSSFDPGEITEASDAFLVKLVDDTFETVNVDFGGDGKIDTEDIDSLVQEIQAGTNGSTFDLSGDGAVDNSDLTLWLRVAADENGFASAYLPGDANLDGSVQFDDFLALSAGFGGPGRDWSQGNFNADEEIDFADFLTLSSNFGLAVPERGQVQIVPEPSTVFMLPCLLTLLLCGRQRHAPRMCFVKNWQTRSVSPQLAVCSSPE